MDPTLIKLDPDLVPPDQISVVVAMAVDSCSCQNLAWRLVKYMFRADELHGHNCFGRRGKQCLDRTKLHKVKHIVFSFYVVDSEKYEMESAVWKQCCVAIDKGIRNTYERYNSISSSGFK